jgi:hypothetical protein
MVWKPTPIQEVGGRATRWIYLGEFRVRHNPRVKLTYIHIPPRLVRPLGFKHVVVKAIVRISAGCEASRIKRVISSLPPGGLMFKGTISRAGGSYRLVLPAKTARLLEGFLDCIVLAVFIAPLEPEENPLLEPEAEGEAVR